MSFKLVVLIIIVLGAIAVAQLIKLYEHSYKLRNRGEEEIPNRDNRLNASMLLVFGVVLFAFFIWLMAKYGYVSRGEAASAHGEGIDWLFDVNFVIIFAVFFLTNGALFWFSYKYVRKPGVKALFFTHSNKLELIWTVIPAIVLAFIIIVGLKSWNDITAASDDQAINVEIFSEQFKWTARYAGPDNTLGGFDYKLTTNNNPLALVTSASLDTAIRLMEYGSNDGSILGMALLEKKLNDPNNMFIPKDRVKMEKELDSKSRLVRLLHQMRARHDVNRDANAYDDVLETDTLHLIVDQDYEFTFRAKDVIHSVYMPHFRLQMNTVPGMVTRFKMRPTITTTEIRKRRNNPTFNYVILCNKVCGSAHYKMKMIVVVETKAEFDKWMASKKNFGTTFLASAEPTLPVEATPTDSLQVAIN